MLLDFCDRMRTGISKLIMHYIYDSFVSGHGQQIELWRKKTGINPNDYQVEIWYNREVRAEFFEQFSVTAFLALAWPSEEMITLEFLQHPFYSWQREKTRIQRREVGWMDGVTKQQQQQQQQQQQLRKETWAKVNFLGLGWCEAAESDFFNILNRS